MLSIVQDRLTQYGRLAQAMLKFLLLPLLWLALVYFFILRMIPRLANLAPGRAIAIDGAPCNNPQCDFSAFWPAGVAARSGHFLTIYDPSAFEIFRRAVLFPGVKPEPFVYPPPALAGAMAVAHLPFEIGFVVWTLALTAAGTAILRWARLPWPVIIAGVLSPASLWCLEVGQISIFSSACLIAALLMADGKPARAALGFGLLVVKPQAALIAPFALAGAGYWKTFWMAGGAVAALAALTTLLLGQGAWSAYLAHAGQSSALILNAPFGRTSFQGAGVSVLWMMRSLGAGLGPAYAVQLLASLTTIGATFCLWRRPAMDPIDRMAITVCLALLATPYGFINDMVGYEIGLAAVLARRGWRFDALDVGFWFAPVLCPLVSAATGVLVTPLIIIGFAWRTWRRSSRAEIGPVQAVTE
jgi:hypothetical protein